jgi:hypothetical protein
MTNPDRSQPSGLHQTPPPGHPRVQVHVPVADGLPSEFIEPPSAHRLPSLRLLEQSVSAPGQKFLELLSVMARLGALFRRGRRVGR